MATISANGGPKAQLEAGASILDAASTVDTRVIKARLAAFERAQRVYHDAHQAVLDADGQLAAAHAALEGCDAAQDAAIEALAGALGADGQRRTNPFAAFGAPAPSKLKLHAAADKAAAVQALVAAVQRDKNRSKLTLQAAQKADSAARAATQAVAEVRKAQAAGREARHARGDAAKAWETELAGLKRGARAAIDEGAPHLYVTLFDRKATPAPRKAKPTPTPPAPTPPSPPVAAPTSAIDPAPAS